MNWQNSMLNGEKEHTLEHITLYGKGQHALCDIICLWCHKMDSKQWEGSTTNFRCTGFVNSYCDFRAKHFHRNLWCVLFLLLVECPWKPQSFGSQDHLFPDLGCQLSESLCVAGGAQYSVHCCQDQTITPPFHPHPQMTLHLSFNLSITILTGTFSTPQMENDLIKMN